MKIHVLLILILCGFDLSGQYYIEGIAPPEIGEFNVDLSKFKADSLYEAGEYESASAVYENLRDNWRSILDWPNPTEQQLQNYFYTEVFHLKTRFKIGHRKESYLSMKNLESQIRNRLSPDHLFFGMYYHEMGLMTFQHEGDAQKSFDQTYKASQIREEQLSEFKKDLGWSYNNLAIIARRLYGVDSSLHYLHRSLEVRKEIIPADPAMILVSYSNISQAYLVLGNNRLEKEYLLKAEKAGKALDPDHPYNLMVITNLAKVHYAEGDFRNSLANSKHALSLRKKNVTGEGIIKLRDNYLTIANNYMNLGYPDSSAMYLDTLISFSHQYDSNYAITLAYAALARTQDNDNEAINTLKKAIELCEVDSECYEVWLANIYHDISIIYLRKNDPYQALIFALKARNSYELKPEKNDEFLVKIYRTLARISAALDNKKDAIKFLESSIDIQNRDTTISNQWVIEPQRLLAGLYSSVGEYEKAERIFDNLLAQIEGNPNIARQILRDVYGNLFVHYSNKGDHEPALKAAIRSRSYNSHYKTDYSENARSAIRLHQAYKRIGDLQAAEAEFNEACRILGVESWLSQDFKSSQIPSFRLISSLEQIIELYRFDDNYFYEDIDSQLELIRTIIDLIDKCRDNYFFYDSEQQLHDIESGFYDLVVEQLYNMYTTTPDEKLIEVVLLVIEKSRSIGLGRVNERQKLIDSDEVPSEIIAEENRINFQSEKAFLEYKNNNIDSKDSLLSDLTLRLDQLNKDKDDFIQKLAREYPSYHQERYKHNVIDLDQAKTICHVNDVGILNYYSTGDRTYGLYITLGNIYFKSFSDEGLWNKIVDLKSLLSSSHNTATETDHGKNKRLFMDLSYDLYNILIGKEVTAKLPEKLVIIPDGELMNLPFEVLLSDRVAYNSKFRSLPYLIREKVISYNGSLSQYNNDQRRSIGQGYQGYAPIYSRDDNRSKMYNDNVEMQPLKKNIEEIERSAILFGGRQFIGNDANVDTFKNNIGDVSILHLAMHTSIDNDIPLDSYLSFTKEDMESKSRLYAHEIVELNINADLVILSACETNAGEHVDGEGVRGIAKSFFIAACPNLIITNWLVDDYSSSKIMYSFLEEIKLGVDPALALRNSKIDFIDNSSNVHTHPSYWAAFSYYGTPLQDTDSIFSGSAIYYMTWFCFLGLLLILLGYRSLKSKNVV